MKDPILFLIVPVVVAFLLMLALFARCYDDKETENIKLKCNLICSKKEQTYYFDRFQRHCYCVDGSMEKIDLNDNRI